MNMMGNSCQFTVDGNGYVYSSFIHQNRIEKYSPEGKVQWRAERELNYSMKPPKQKGKMERSGGNVMIQAPEMNQCSSGIAVDGKGRVWVVTLNRQIKEEERVGTVARVEQGASGRNMSMSTTGNTDLRKTDMYKLEVFDPDGVLFGSFPLDHFVNDIRIHGDKIYLLDRDRGAQFYEYRIIE
jgi:sugar lactone lactonase YvrE